MRSYRLYRLGANGQIQSAQWIEAVGDDAALFEAKQISEMLAMPCEVWDGSRKIGRVGEMTGSEV